VGTAGGLEKEKRRRRLKSSYALVQKADSGVRGVIAAGVASAGAATVALGVTPSWAWGTTTGASSVDPYAYRK